MYCKPHNTCRSDQASAIAARLAAFFEACDRLNSYVLAGDILKDIQDCRNRLQDALEAEGWTVSAMDGQCRACDTIRVYPPGSPSGARIRKWREKLQTRADTI